VVTDLGLLDEAGQGTSIPEVRHGPFVYRDG